MPQAAVNIAEGAGEFSPGDSAPSYRMARRTATECAAILDARRATNLGLLAFRFEPAGWSANSC